MAEAAQARKEMKVSDEVAVQITKMNKWYGTFHVLRDIDLTVRRGERIVIAGPSGSGKSTLIRCINRLEEHQSGQIIVDGTELTNDISIVVAPSLAAILMPINGLLWLIWWVLVSRGLFQLGRQIAEA